MISQIFNKKIIAKTKFLYYATIFLLLFNYASYLFTNNVNAQIENLKTDNTSTLSHGKCNCVIFRIDDINNHFLPKIQIFIMNEFILKNQSLSLGLIMHQIDNESIITEKIKEGKQKGLFELDIHGWDHVDYTTLSKEEQFDTLQQSNEKMATIFGNYSQVFIPPYNKFNGDTIGVLKSVGVRIFSADTSTDRTQYFIADGVNRESLLPTLYHLPAMTSFKNDNGNGTWEKVPIPTILNEIDRNIDKYGYAIVLLHPQNFAKMENNVFVDTLDEKEINDLSVLIDSIKSKNQHITTFANVIGFNNLPISLSNTVAVPEFNGLEVIQLLASILIVITFTVVTKRSSKI